MIARRWRVWTNSGRAEQLADYLSRTGVADALATEGNRGALLLREDDADGGEVTFTLLTFWESRDAVKAFAGSPVDQAVLYPEDARYFSRHEEKVEHVDVVAVPGIRMSRAGASPAEPPSLHLEILDEQFVVAKLRADEPLPDWAVKADRLTSITRSETELSIVAAAEIVPPDVPAVGPWRALRVRGPLDFELTGVLAALAAPLAQAAVSIFAISTFDTDYLLVRADSLARAVEVLRDAGHGVDRPGDEGGS